MSEFTEIPAGGGIVWGRIGLRFGDSLTRVHDFTSVEVVRLGRMFLLYQNGGR